MSDELQRPRKERRHLTVMFVDLVGSTGLVDALDPEDAQEVFDDFSEACTGLIAEHGGYVARIEGDGVLAYFGFPTAREDAIEQAVRSGLAISEAVGRIRTPLGSTLACRTGIASGSVLVGEAHTSSGSVFYEVIGRAPHVARRLQEQVDPGEVAVSDAVYRKAGGFFMCTPHPPIRLKGFRNPEMFWRVRGQRELPLRFLARDALQRSAFVGRTEELTVLHRLWDSAMSGKGSAIGVIGPAGIGKSRTVYEFVHAISEDAPSVMLLQANAHHRNSPWQPLLQDLSRHLDAETPSGGSRLETLARELSPSPDEKDHEDARAILALMEDGHAGSGASRPAEERARVVAALVRRLEGLARNTPVVLVVEDVHWLDESSLEWLEALSEAVTRHAILIVMTSREGLAARSTLAVTEIALSGLKADDARAMVDQLIAEKPFAQLEVQSVLAKVGGIPLFIEEYVTHQIDRLVARSGDDGATAVDVDDAPTTLMDLLNERIDELGPGKRFIQTCAVCGDVFDLRLVARVVGMDVDRAISLLSDFESRGILTGSAAVGDEFRFRHALLRDAGYSSLLKADRIDLHARIAEAMVVHAESDGFEATPEVTAWHFAEAGNIEKSLTYRLSAAERFKGQFAATEAIRQLDLAAAAAEALPDAGPRREWLVRIYNQIGATRSVFYGWGDPAGQEVFEKALSLSETGDDTRSTFDAVQGLWNATMIQGNFPTVAVLARQLRTIADRSNDPVMKIMASNCNGAYRLWSGKFDEARGCFNEVTRLYTERGGNSSSGTSGTDPKLVALCLGALNNWFLGERDAAFESIEEAKEQAEQLGQAFSLAYAYSISASIRQADRNYDLAKADSEKSIAYATANQATMRYWIDRSGIILGWATSYLGDFDGGIGRIQESIDSYQAAGGGLHLSYARTLLAECLLMSGAVEAADTELKRAQQALVSDHPYYYDSERLRLIGEAMARLGHFTESAAAFASALATAEAFGSTPLRQAVIETQTRFQHR